MPDWWDKTFGTAESERNGGVTTAERGFGKTPEELAEEERKKRQAALDAQIKAAKTREEAQVALAQSPDLASGYNLDVLFPGEEVPEVKPPEPLEWQRKVDEDLRALQEQHPQYQAVDPYAEIRDPVTGKPTLRITSEDQYLTGIRDLSGKLGVTAAFPPRDIGEMSPQERRIYRDSLRKAYRNLLHLERDARMGHVPEDWGVDVTEPDLSAIQELSGQDLASMSPVIRKDYLSRLKRVYGWDIEAGPMTEWEMQLKKFQAGISQGTIEPVPTAYRLETITPNGWRLSDDRVTDPEGNEYTLEEAKAIPGVIERLQGEFSEIDIREMVEFAEAQPEEFVTRMRQAGDIPLTRAVLGRMGLEGWAVRAIIPEAEKREAPLPGLLDTDTEKRELILQKLEERYGPVPEDRRAALKELISATKPMAEQYEEWETKWAGMVTKPWRGEQPFREWEEEHPLAGGVARMFEPILWIQPGAKGPIAAKTAVKLALGALKKGATGEKLVAELVEKGMSNKAATQAVAKATDQFVKEVIKKGKGAFTEVAEEAAKVIPKAAEGAKGNWREAFDATDDPSRKADILRAIADSSKVTLKELDDILARVTGLPEEANIRWVVEQKLPKAAPKAAEAIPKAAEAMPEVAAKLAPESLVPPVGEKAAGAVAKVGEEVAPKVVRGVDDISDITTKVKKLVDSANEAMKAQKLLRKPEQAARFGAIKAIREAAELPLEAGKQALAKLKGELPKGQWEEWEALQLTGEELSRLVGNAQRNPNISEGEFVRLFEVLTKKLAAGEIPQKNEIELLRKAFGVELPTTTTGWRIFLDVLNIPRSLLSSVDHSMVLRQNILITTGHPLISAKAAWKSLSKSFRKVSSEDLLKTIVEDADYKILKDSGMSFTQWGAKLGGKLQAREEEFASSLASRIPWVAWSERLAANFLNLTRLHVGKKGLQDLEILGVIERVGDDIVKGEGILQQWTKMVNAATGRGALGPLTDAQPLLNAVLFSPKLQAARLQIPYYYGKVLLGAAKGNAADRYFAKQMTRWIGSFVAFGVTFLGLCKLAGGEVETDPRSSSFAKGKFGNTRLSPLAGFEQYIVLAARLATGKIKTTGGHIVKFSDINSSRWQLLGRFTEFKYAPIFSIVRDILEGENVMGEPLEFTPKGVGKEIYNRTVSMFVQDVVEAYQDAGVFGALGVAPAAFFGMGAQTYEPPSAPSELASWVAALKREEDEIQRLIRQDKMSEAYKIAQNNPLLNMEYDSARNEYYSMTRRNLQSELAKIHVVRAEYNRIEETKSSLLDMTEEQKKAYLELLEGRMDAMAEPVLELLNKMQGSGK